MTTQANIDGKLPSAEIVLVQPSDIPFSPEAVQSLQEMAKRTEEFFTKWLHKRGYPPQRKEIFSRATDGSICIRTHQGKEPISSGIYDTSNTLKEHWPQKQIVEEVEQKYSIPRNENYYWIFVWLSSNRKFRDWNGSGKPHTGGRCIVAYPEGGDFQRPKTHIHEFGHALGLPHIGPRREDVMQGYCSLMGPRDDGYRKKMGDNYRDFCLTLAEAAMLANHPVFTGMVDNRRIIPRVNLLEYAPRFDRSKNAITVTGRLQTNTDIECHSVVVVDEASTVNDYWRKGYVSRLGKESSFSVTVSEPIQTCGMLRILPCFVNGINTGDGKHAGLCSAINKNYHWTGNEYQFQE